MVEGKIATRGRMLITKHFLFLHLPKTGGTFLTELCYRNLPREWRIPNDLHPHAPYSEVKERFGHLPMVCFVRNPWDWYVSWYHYLVQNPPPGPHTLAERPMWVLAFEGGRSDFATVVRRACTGEGFGNRLTQELMGQRGIDHYSALYRLKVGDGVDEGKVDVGRFENLAGDFLGFLERHEVPVDERFSELVRLRAPLRVSRRGDYHGYYEDDLRDLVGEKARELIERYGYSF
jgi:hypothetical protein